LNSCTLSICDHSGRRKQIRTHLLDGWHNRPDAAVGIPARIPVRDLHPGARHRTQISVLNFFVRIFVNTFGITQPAPGSEARAGRFIALMLTALLVLLVAAAALLRAAFLR
jgi:hypothetical protein